MQSVLAAALRSTDEPPLSMADITRALGYDQANFRRYFPELCRAISRRHRDYLMEKRRERLQKLSEEVRQTTLSLHPHEWYPVIRQFAQLLPKPPPSLTP